MRGLGDSVAAPLLDAQALSWPLLEAHALSWPLREDRGRSSCTASRSAAIQIQNAAAVF